MHDNTAGNCLPKCLFALPALRFELQLCFWAFCWVHAYLLLKKGSPSRLTIPSALDGRILAALGSHAFMYRYSQESPSVVNLGEGEHLKAMGNYKDYFNSCKVLEHYNYTKDKLEKDEDPSLRPITVIIIVICCFIILENLLVLMSVWRNKKFHSAMYIFIGNLAFSDLLAGTAFIANVVLSGPATFLLTPLQWFVREGTAFATLAASVFSLLAIAIERHVAITKVKVYSSDKSCRMVLLIGACWVISAIIGGLPVLGWNCMNQLKDCSTVLPLYSKRYIFFVVTVFSLILLSIVVLYVRIYRIVRSSHAEIASSQTMALLRTVTFVLGAFIICWLPAFIILLVDALCARKTCTILYQAKYFFAFATLNSAINPLIYTLRSKDMRKEFLRVLCCWGIMGQGKPAERCMIPLRSSSSLDRCTQKQDLTTSPFMKERSTFV